MKEYKISGVSVLSAPNYRFYTDTKSTSGSDDIGVHYLSLLDRPSRGFPLRARHANSAVLRHLRFAGISLAYERNDIYFAPMPPRQVDLHKTLKL